MTAPAPDPAAVPHNPADIIHIVGLYKCGSSWLLHMLSAHPEVAGWGEFDVLRACYRPDRRPHTLPATAADYLRRDGSHEPWLRRREAVQPRALAEIFLEMFLGRGWIPLMGIQRQRAAQALDRRDLPALVDELLRVGEFQLRRSDGPLISPGNHSKTLGVVNYRRNDLIALMQAVRDCEHVDEIPELFYRSLQSQLIPGTRMACKAADQLMMLGRLERACPGSRKIAIIRDGRDAVVSARHFEKLMRQREAPWRVAPVSGLRRLLGWALRAAKLAEHARRGEVLVVRYEDLKTSFDPVCTRLFANLGLAHDADTISQVRTLTDFRTVTAGRNPGEAAEHEIRSGRSGEWQDAFSSGESRRAWKIAGRELAAFGFREDGSIAPSSLVLGGTDV